MTKLRVLQKHHPLIGDVRGLVLMSGKELVRDKKLTPAATEGEVIRDAQLRNGVLVGGGDIYGNVIRFQPPLTSRARRSIRRWTHSQQRYRK
jgi:alanine-glyoxylate transaminase / (R)-3-amino-2-methylpropionate-pyruvate transaminase